MARSTAETWRHIDFCSLSVCVYIIASRRFARSPWYFKLTSHWDSTDTSGNLSHHVSMCRGVQNSHSGDKWHSPYSVSIPNLGVSQLNVSQVEVPLQGSDSGCTLVRLDPCEEFLPGFLPCTLQVSLGLTVSTGMRSKPHSIADTRC